MIALSQSGEAQENPDCDERISLRAQARKELTRMALQ